MRINLTTLGCPKNLVDSELLLGGLKGDGVELVDDPETADTIILNTCGFIQGAKEESIDAILQAVELKNAGSCQRVFVTGCLSQRYRDELTAEIPEVDGFYGNRDMKRILKSLTERLQLKRNLVGERHLATPGHYAYLKISEGCENPCTFCSIPAIRGPFKSQPVERLAEEAYRLAHCGVRELILIAQDSTIYGRDLYGEKRLIPLLDQLCAIPGLEWIRLLYTYPAHFDQHLIDFIADQPKINYIDMPIQHISDRLLKLMGRKVTRARIEEIISRLRARRPELPIRSTLIVGFPGETDADHQEMLDFVDDIKFTRLGLFTYSREENTPSFGMPDQVPDYIKQERWAELNDVQNQISRELNDRLVGSTQRVLVDESSPLTGHSTGRTSRDCPEIDNFVSVAKTLEPGRFYEVRINGSSDYELTGDISF